MKHDPIDKRVARRVRVLLSAALETGEGERVAHLLNISSTGAKLDADEPPAVDEAVTLVRGGIRAPGRVSWVEAHRFGVHFDERLDPALIAEHAASLARRPGSAAEH